MESNGLLVCKPKSAMPRRLQGRHDEAIDHPADPSVRREPEPRCAENDELRRARGYPLARWYLRPAAGWLAEQLVFKRVRPEHLTCCGLLAAGGATAILLLRCELAPVAAALVLLYWFFDRADGQLARRQGTASAWGAWLDGNVDELADVALHVAVAAAVAAQVGAPWPWLLLVAFLSGKYLFMCGLMLEEEGDSPIFAARKSGQSPTCQAGTRTKGSGFRIQDSGFPAIATWLRALYHLPGNADVRLHLLVLALVTGWLSAELALVAAYYNLRWMVRYALVARRLRGAG